MLSMRVEMGDVIESFTEFLQVRSIVRVIALKKLKEKNNKARDTSK